MPQALGSLGSIFGQMSTVPTWMKAILGGLAGFGEIGNILNMRKRSDLMNQEEKWAKLTPQQLSAKVAAATQPLSAGLTQSVGNIVQGEMGERGLGQAPGIFSGSLAQALAPYYQQNQSTALQEILRQMGIPLEEASMLPGMQDNSGLMALLMASLSKPQAPPSVTNSPTIGDTGLTPPIDWGGGAIPV